MSVEQQRIIDVALVELTRIRDVGDFTLEKVARQAGVGEAAVRQFWPNTPALFTAALLAWGEREMPIPDTGSLRGDLLEYALSYAKAVNTPLGRILLDTVVISRKDWDVRGSREAFRRARPNRLVVLVQRAIDRGECPKETDPAFVVELLASALSTPALFYDNTISDDFCRQVVELFLHGIQARPRPHPGSAPRPGRDP